MELKGHNARCRAYIFQFHKGTIRTSKFEAKEIKDDKFQFHKGTIRTSRLFGHPSSPPSFQFHKGTIRTPYCMFLITSSLFQFHKGTIRTVYLGLFGEKHFHFNSIKVQLERIATC